MKITLKMNHADKILLKRSMGKSGKAQRFFTHEVRRLSEPYIPFQSGNLKDDAVIEEKDKIHYNAPYARKQYYENKGNSNGEPLRGKRWTERMWADRGGEIVQSVARFVGGKKG